jgi:peptidyl-tRNA hydrolase, PTH1 family
MKCIIGLGNPGLKYQQTRHNVGFMAMDELAEQLGGAFSLQKKIQAEVAKFAHPTQDNQQLILIKPQTFMNESGQAVRSFLEYYQDDFDQTDLSNLHVIHDDLDLEVGSYKKQLGVGPQQHNGLTSLYQHLGSKQFWHHRVGVDGRNGQRVIPAHEYVLSKFSPEDLHKIGQTITQVTADLLA